MTSRSLDPTKLVHGKTFLTGLQLTGGVLTAKRMRGCFFCFPAIFLGRAVGLVAVDNGNNLVYLVGTLLLLRDTFFISFQNAFEMATFVWFVWGFKQRSCFMKNHTMIIIRLTCGVLVHFWCSYSTVPLKVIVTLVCDDLEVNEFMEFVVKSSRIVTLCIAECSVNGRQSSTTGSKQQSNFIHATPSVNVYQTEYHATQMHVFPGSSGLIYKNLLSYQQMHRFSKNPVYVPRFLRYLMQDHQSDSANHKSKQVVGSLKHRKPSVFGEVKRLASKDESSESDDESSESDEEGCESDEVEEITPVENRNYKVMSESSRIYRGKEIMTDMKARFKVDISYFQAWRAKCYALKLLRGTPEESFAELPLYCHNLKVKNSRTITHIETHDQDRFEIFFLAVGDAIRTFVSHIRPLIIIDGAHLKALEIVAPRGPTVEGTQVKPRDEIFWFGKPEILLRLIQLISFQNAFEKATFVLASKDESSESHDESSESDEEGNESDADEETTPVKNKNCKVDKFWSMPPLLQTPVFDLKKKEVMSESSRIYRGKEIMTDMKARFKVDISYF
nr:hypothetical protein [Tanacetum cinerariifolium]